MELKPGYKKTEIGVIPEEWESLESGTVLDYFGGNAFKSTDATSVGVRWLKIANVGTRKAEWDDTSYLPESFQQKYRDYLLDEGDVVMALTRPILNDELKIVTLGSDDVPSLLNQRVARVASKEAGDICFLFHVLRGSGFVNSMIDAMAGSDPPNISTRTLKKICIAIPPLPEQRAIAAALSDVDALIASLDRLIAKKRDLKKAAMQELLTGKRRLPGFTGEWEEKLLGEIANISMGRTPSRLISAFWGSGYKWLSIADLKSKIVSDSKEEVTELAASEMTVVPKGTLLMSFKLSIGRLCFAGCDLFTNEAICSFNNLQANSEFLFYLLGRTDFSLYGKQAVKGYTLNKESLRSVNLLMPSLPEQAAIATILSDMDAEIVVLEQKRDKTRMLKQGMMQELLTGRIRLV